MKNKIEFISAIVIALFFKLSGYAIPWYAVILIPISVWLTYTVMTDVAELYSKRLNYHSLRSSSYIPVQSLLLFLQLSGICSVSWAFILFPTLIEVIEFLIVLLFRFIPKCLKKNTNLSN